MRTIRLALLLTLAAGPAAAHTGAGAVHGFAAGVTHPLMGLDHLLAMVAVGLWAGCAGGRARFAWPAAFLAAMILGAAGGLTLATPPGLELGIALSVVSLGLAAALRLAPSLAVGAAVCGVFAVLHGWAHGAEAGEAGALAYVAGFTLSTAALHGLGVLLASLRRPLLPRLAGGAVAAAGLVLLVA